MRSGWFRIQGSIQKVGEKDMRMIVFGWMGISIVAGIAIAQDAQKEIQREDKVRVERDVLNFASPKDNIVYERNTVGAGAGFAQFISVEDSIPGKIVKNAPYSAEAVTETTQTLADGNRIAHKTTAATYRDSEGRTRRDMTLPAIGPLATGDAPSFVIINDPVANMTYHLDTKAKTARKMPGLGPMGVTFLCRHRRSGRRETGGRSRGIGRQASDDCPPDRLPSRNANLPERGCPSKLGDTRQANH